MKLLKLIFVFIIFCQAVFALPLGKHTFHTSLTRIDYNAKDKNIEISLQLFSHDLITVLEKQNKTNIDLENTKDIDNLILKYLETNFVIKDKSGEAKKLNWVGKEVSVDTVYVYLETASDVDLTGFTMQNTIFFESFPQQTNWVLAKYGEKKADLFFKPGDKYKEFTERK